MAASPSTPWSVSAGISGRRMSADFSFGLPKGIPWLSVLGLGSYGPGDRGLYDGGSPVSYTDGTVGLSGGPSLTDTTFNSSTQVGDTGRTDILGDPISEVRFHSYEVSHSYTTSLDDVPGDSDLGAGVFVRFSGSLPQLAGFTPSLSLQWTGLRTSAGITDERFATITAIEHRTDYTYAYDAFILSPDGTGFVIYDADSLPGNADPRKGKRSSSRVVDYVDAFATADLDVLLNEVALSVDVQRYITPKLSLALSLGPTLNFVNTDFDGTVEWRRRSTGRTLVRETMHESKTEIEIGFMAALFARYDLTPDQKWFVEAHAGYHWLNEVNWKAGTASGSVDLASWDVGVGFGHRF